MGAARAAAGGEGGEEKTTHDGSRNLIIFVTFEASWSGGGGLQGDVVYHS